MLPNIHPEQPAIGVLLRPRRNKHGCPWFQTGSDRFPVENHLFLPKPTPGQPAPGKHTSVYQTRELDCHAPSFWVPQKHRDTGKVFDTWKDGFLFPKPKLSLCRAITSTLRASQNCGLQTTIPSEELKIKSSTNRCHWIFSMNSRNLQVGSISTATFGGPNILGISETPFP